MINIFLKENNFIYEIALNPDEDNLIVKTREKLYDTGYEKTDREILSLYSINNKLELMKSVINESDDSHQFKYHPSGKFLALADNGVLKIWSMPEFEEYSKIQLIIKLRGEDTPETLRSIAFSQDGKYLIVGTGFGSVYLIDWKKMEVLSEAGDYQLVTSISFIPESYQFIAGFADSVDSVIHSAKIIDNQIIGIDYENSEEPLYCEQGGDIYGVVSPDGKLYAFSNGKAIIMELPSGNIRYEFLSDGSDNIEKDVRFKNDFWSNPIFTEDSRYLIMGNHSGSIFIWSANTGEMIKEFQSPEEKVSQLVYSSKRKILYSLGNYQVIRKWDISPYIL